MSETVDREAIRHLMAVYNINGDRGRIDALAGAFTEDGTIEFSGQATSGRAAIAARLSGKGTRNPALELSRHHLTTSLIELDGDTATARSYFQVVTNQGLDHHGHYADRLVRTAEGWRIAHRSVRIDYQSPDTLFAPLHVRGRTPA
ncbi:nuclear transport factor 2 family protein [Sphingomonas immobilis]|uniref:Nuclear transport factor 2 family protein n=1 Tax=Sphingomonas immobilis TaxID=3063997 RepID=A0ABT8ZWZ4_9SPHN|nr:nuclear transport factor 2 family protein [Sphingomonas sp. CA1-15]MDO7842068.1 nuclear transport factor 2 family protein [Sphingomonas sp. CA1-15]